MLTSSLLKSPERFPEDNEHYVYFNLLSYDQPQRPISVPDQPNHAQQFYSYLLSYDQSQGVISAPDLPDLTLLSIDPQLLSLRNTPGILFEEDSSTLLALKPAPIRPELVTAKLVVANTDSDGWTPDTVGMATFPKFPKFCDEIQVIIFGMATDDIDTCSITVKRTTQRDEGKRQLVVKEKGRPDVTIPLQ